MAAFAGVTFSHSSKLDETAAILVDNVELQSQLMTGVLTTNVQSTITAIDSTQVCRVTVYGANVWVKVGNNPVAAAGTGFLVLAGTTEYFALNKSDKVAIFEVA
jgi:hypothetical protein